MRRFDAAECLALIEKHRIDRVHFVPTMMQRIWKLPRERAPRRDVSSLEFVMTGARRARLADARVDRVARTRRACFESYGADRAHRRHARSRAREWLAHPGSVGRPRAGAKLRILDPETLEDVPPGEIGEVFMLPPGGPGSTYRYVGATGARASPTAGSRSATWATSTPTATCTWSTAARDMIVSGGANVYPAEVEAALDEHPAVRSSCVIGLPDEDLGKRVHALVELRARGRRRRSCAPTSPSASCTTRCPRSFERVSEPLRDDAGKVRRSALREQRLGRTSRCAAWLLWPALICRSGAAEQLREHAVVQVAVGPLRGTILPVADLK